MDQFKYPLSQMGDVAELYETIMNDLKEESLQVHFMEGIPC